MSVFITAVAGLSFSLLLLTNSGAAEQRATSERLSAQYVAEAAMVQSIDDLMAGGDGAMGSDKQPLTYGEASNLWVDSTDIGGGLRTLSASGIDRGQGYRIDMVLQEVSNSVFTWAAFGDVSATMDSNAKVDSYDSSLGTYASQAVNGKGSDKWALEKGNVGTNQDALMKSNTLVFGDLTPGPTGTAILTGKAAVSGSTAPNSDSVSLDPLTIPSFGSAGSLAVASTKTLPSGDYEFDDVSVDGTLTIVGPATVVVDNMVLKSNSEVLVDGSAGPVEFFVRDDFVMNSNTAFAPISFDPAELQLNLNSDNVFDPSVIIDLDDVAFESNAEFHGTVYAPNAAIEINSNFELFGSLVAYSVHLDSNSQVHFDENLLNASSASTITLTPLMWRGSPFKP